MKIRYFLASLSLLTLCLAFAGDSSAAITAVGDVSPSDPSSWNSLTYNALIGATGSGSVTVDGGSQLSTNSATIGQQSSSTGLVTVTGTGSSWNTGYEVSVGEYGSGTLTIADGGSVNGGALNIGLNSGSSGVVNITGSTSKLTGDSLDIGCDGRGTLSVSGGATVDVGYYCYINSLSTLNFGIGGGMLTTTTLFASPNQITGSGTIYTNGLVSDVDLILDSEASLKQTLTFGESAAVNLDLVTNTAQRRFGAGYLGSGSVTICGGITVKSGLGELGVAAGSTGAITVSGKGTLWDMGAGNMIVGCAGNGFLTVKDGATVSSRVGWIGLDANSSGTITVTGTGAQLLLSDPYSSFVTQLVVGFNSAGTARLNITDGGVVSVIGRTTFGDSGSLYLDGGTLTTDNLQTKIIQLTGSGTINTQGLVSDYALVFDSQASLKQTITLGHDESIISLNLDVSGSAGVNGDLGGNSISIRNGVTVNCHDGYVDAYDGIRGIATVSGTNSVWNVSNDLYIGVGSLTISDGSKLCMERSGDFDSPCCLIGYVSRCESLVTVRGTGSSLKTTAVVIGKDGNGTLRIRDGGSVSDDSAYLGQCLYPESLGVAVVSGLDSIWTSGEIYVGGLQYTEEYPLGLGVLTIADGGRVSANQFSVNARSLMTIDVSNGSQLSISDGGGTITNDGTARIAAGAKAIAGKTYTPIAASTFSGSGVYQALGGTWNAAEHTFIASTVQSAKSGEAVEMNLATIQRALVEDAATGWKVGAGFLAATSDKTLKLTATTASKDELAALQALAGENQKIKGAWTFTLESGYAEGDPAYLSFEVGGGLSVDDVRLWHFDGATWASYAAADLNYDGEFVNFTVTSFSGYAVTVPEPAAALLLIVAAFMAAIRIRRDR